VRRMINLCEKLESWRMQFWAHNELFPTFPPTSEREYFHKTVHDFRKNTPHISLFLIAPRPLKQRREYTPFQRGARAHSEVTRVLDPEFNTFFPLFFFFFSFFLEDGTDDASG